MLKRFLNKKGISDGWMVFLVVVLIMFLVAYVFPTIRDYFIK